MVLEQSLQVDLLAILALETHLVGAEAMHAVSSLSLSLLHTGPQFIPRIGHHHIPFTQGKMMQPLGAVTVTDLDLL